MTTINPVDIQYSLIKETVPGTLPGAGNLLKIPVDSTGTLFNVDVDDLTSPVSRPQGDIDGARRTNYRNAGNFALHLQQDAAIELLMSSALRAAWTAGVIKGSNVDQPFSIEEKLAAAQFKRYLGNYATMMELTCDFAGNALLRFDILGMTAQTATTASSLAYSEPGVAQKLTGLDVGTAEIAGYAGIIFKNAVLRVGQPREVQGRFGSASAYGIGASGPREVSLELTGYHEDLAPITALLGGAGDTPLAATLTIGTAGNGFTFLLPKAVPSTPKQAKEPSAIVNTIALRGIYDATEGTAIKITKLS
ncbi:MAG: phage tail tube protein [Pseudomonadota bacterium]|nr:phage tail tube protein [Pseudomonadota bacterium]